MIVRPFHFRKFVTTAGTREQLTTNERHVTDLLIQAEIDNTGYVYVGNNQVSSSNYMALLVAGASLSLDSADLGSGDAKIDPSEIWLDVSVSTDGVLVGFMEQVSR